jgi:predicted GNAT family acetyltransferase
MEIIHQQDEKGGAFIAMENGERAGEMTYIFSGEGKWVIDHTETNPAYRGRGIGRSLLDQLIAFARLHAIRIIPVCPFARGQFQKDKTIQDILA